MRTDKQIFQILQAQPEWIYLLSGEPSPGPCRFESITFKAIEKHSDGLLVPEAAEIKLKIVEIQGYEDTFIYQRVVIEMALVQQQYPGREVEGLIIFLDESDDPRSEPWTQVVRSISLRDAIEQIRRAEPHHPLVAVFRPLLAESDEILEREAAPCYNSIQESDLTREVRNSLIEVFLNWIEQRLKHKGKKEIEEMLLGQLPDIRDTQTGKDLIAIGKSEGKIECLLKLLETRFGEIPATLKERLNRIETSERIDELYEHALTVSKLSEFTP